eukprot:TRINITY_DN2025_c0_g1_i1.p1 TRINITY_DN2025_c0_g1~~TRINITY_DN2025_c0_g1_i1.p1  ORF type:complete len:215 (-),score=43.62 TRINITY_DN2025_c0_g1_i1:43-651(-)
MDSVLGFVGEDYVLIACDATASRSVVLMKSDQDKIMKLDSHKLLGWSGDGADAVQFCEFIQKNMNLYALQHDFTLTTAAAASFTRGELAQSLRKKPYQVNLLLGGYDKADGAQMFFIDYLGSMHNMKTAGHGYGSFFTLSTMDRLWKPNMSREDGYKLIYKCIKELKVRFSINYPNFVVKVVSKDGIEVIPKDVWAASAGKK